MEHAQHDEKPAHPVGKEIIIKAQVPYSDERGSMDYHVLTEPVDWVGTIFTKKGAIRANHYHPEQEQKLLTLTGKCISVYRDLSTPNAPIKHHLAGPGDLLVTAPNVAHAVIYLEDTIQLNLVHGERVPDNYGKHTIRHWLVKEEDKQKYIDLYK